jgi:hypothetical protein
VTSLPVEVIHHRRHVSLHDLTYPHPSYSCLILRPERNMIKNARKVLVKYSLFLSDFKVTRIFLERFLKALKYQIA